MFHKNFFKLQLEFSDLLAAKNHESTNDTLFQFTSMYVRVLGFSDENFPNKKNIAWKKVLEHLPKGIENKTDYFYDKYLAYEASKPKKKNVNQFGCFFYTYHNKTNRYELHFTPTDPQGDLGKNRIQERITDLRKLFEAIKKENKRDAIFFVRTWLLNIDAFTRLFPKEFIENKHQWEVNSAQDNSHWGQFVDRFGAVKADLASELLKNVKESTYKQVNSYFPLPALISEIALERLFTFYQ